MCDGRIIDSHFHAYAGKDGGRFIRDLFEKAALSAVNIASCPKGVGYDKYHCNAEGFELKKQMPGKIYVYGGLDYTNKAYLKGKADFMEQARKLFDAGADGMKMVEGKPDARKRLGLSLNSPVFDSFYSFMQQHGYPLLMHVADPEEFWDPDQAPDWARKHGWFWGDGSYRSKEALYKEAEGVMARFPGLKVTFAHFGFLSADIDRASQFLDRWGNARLDITPGWEMYHNFSKKPDEWRGFFVKYQDRIVFGTDSTPAAGDDYRQHLDGAVHSVARIREFLETNHAMYSGNGLNLQAEVLRKVYAGNFMASIAT